MESQSAISKLASAESEQEPLTAQLGTVISAIVEVALGEDTERDEYEARSRFPAPRRKYKTLRSKNDKRFLA